MKMKWCLLLFSLFCQSFHLSACAFEYKVTPNELKNLPLLFYIGNHDDQEKDTVTFYAYARDTGNFTGIGDAMLEIKTSAGKVLFWGYLNLRKDSQLDVNVINAFAVPRDCIDSTVLTITANQADKSIIDGQTAYHGNLFIYRIKLRDILNDCQDCPTSYFQHVSYSSGRSDPRLTQFMSRQFVKLRGHALKVAKGKAQPANNGN